MNGAMGKKEGEGKIQRIKSKVYEPRWSSWLWVVHFVCHRRTTSTLVPTAVRLEIIVKRQLGLIEFSNFNTALPSTHIVLHFKKRRAFRFIRKRITIRLFPRYLVQHGIQIRHASFTKTLSTSLKGSRPATTHPTQRHEPPCRGISAVCLDHWHGEFLDVFPRPQSASRLLHTQFPSLYCSGVSFAPPSLPPPPSFALLYFLVPPIYSLL